MTQRRQGGPPASSIRAATVRACHNASSLPRVPRRSSEGCDTAGSALAAVARARKWLDARRLAPGVVFSRLLVGQAKQARQRLGIGTDGLRVAERFELFGRRQQQLFDDQMR